MFVTLLRTYVCVCTCILIQMYIHSLWSDYISMQTLLLSHMEASIGHVEWFVSRIKPEGVYPLLASNGFDYVHVCTTYPVISLSVNSIFIAF